MTNHRIDFPNGHKYHYTTSPPLIEPSTVNSYFHRTDFCQTTKYFGTSTEILITYFYVVPIIRQYVIYVPKLGNHYNRSVSNKSGRSFSLFCQITYPHFPPHTP